MMRDLPLGRMTRFLCILLFAWQSARALTVDAAYTSAADIPVTANGYTASGNSVAFSLGFAPATGTTLMVVKNTGTGFISGVFTNLSQGQEVSLDHAGKIYRFVANYFGGSGNDLVLQWAATRAVGFGYNAYGQLGNGSTANSDLQVAADATGVLAGKTVTAVAAGGRHSVALCSDGTLAAWGYNSEGQLGNNSTTNSSVPVAVDRSGVLAGKTVVAIAAGNSHSMALCSDGTVVSWGGNTDGQSGSGNNLIGWYLTPVAVDTSGVLAGKFVVAIAAGANHNLALCSDGTLAAWGYNYQGELGNGVGNSESATPVAVNLSGVLSGKTVTGISAGLYHSLAVCSDGTLAAWGGNNNGQLGNGGNTGSLVPVAAGTTGAMSGKSAVAVACGETHSLVLCSDGTLAAWGYGSAGQLGNNSIGDSNIPVAVTQTGILSGKTVTALAGGRHFSLAMCSDGTIAAWGDNYNGQLGDDSTTERRVPVAVQTGTLAIGETFVAGTSCSSAYHSLAIVSMPYIPRIAVEQPAGMVLNNGRSALDFGSCPVGGTISKTFTLRNNGIVPLGITGVTIDGTDASDFAVTTSPAASVDAGNSTTMTVTFTAGAGFNRSAVLHIASNDPNHPVFNVDLAATVEKAFPILYASDSDVPVSAKVFTATGCSVSFDLSHAPATGATLTVVDNTGLGFINGTFSNLAQGQEVALVFNGTTYRFVANYFGGTGNDLVLQWKSTRLMAWGDNTYGQLGNGGTSDADRPTAVNLAGVLAGKTIISTANGYGLSLALCSDGTLASWGRNYAGQLGNGTTTDSTIPVAVNQTGVLSGKRIVAVSAGYDHGLALCSDGTLAAWGNNLGGKLGDGGYTSSSLPVAVNQPALSGKSVVAICAGHYHSLALCSDGKVVTWGDSTSGEVNTLGPLSGKTVVSISAGSNASFALCSDGTAVAWGINSWGKLGIGTFDSPPDKNPILLYTAGALLGKTITAISAGYDHGLAGCADGSLFAWGDNGYGQLGNGNTTDSSEAVAVDATGVLAGKTIVSALAGYQYNLVRCSDGTLVTWGSGSDSALGNGGYLSSSVPVLVQATALSAGEKIISATTAYYSIHNLATVAIPAIPRLALEQPAGIGWASGRGSFDFGSTAPGTGIAKTFTVKNTGTEPLAINGVTIDGTNAGDFTLTAPPASTVAAGASTTFTVTFNATTGIARSAALHIASADPYVNDFRLEMTGTVTGALNIVYNTGAEVPVSGPGFTATGSSVSFSLGQAPVTGADLTVVRNTGLGFINGTFSNLADGQLVTLDFGGISYQFVANYHGGSGNDLVLQWAATKPCAWGKNTSGQLGIGSTVSKSIPTAITTSGVLAGKIIISQATGSTHSLALCSDGTLAAWGSNSSGRFGNGNTTSSNNPVAAGIGGALSEKRVVSISAGADFSLALCADGTLAAWGSNSNGQLGNGTTTSSSVPVAVDMTGALANKRVVAIAAGNSHCLALCSDGTVVSWGYNIYGQLGDQSVTKRTAPVEVPAAGPLAGKTVVAIAAEYYFSLALCSDGTLASWGLNTYGQLGDGSTMNSNVPVAVNSSGALTGKEIKSIAAGDNHVIALCSDGTLAAWGYNGGGQLGTGNTTSSQVPVAVNMSGVLSGRSIVDIAAGANHGIVRCSDGSAAAWGGNSSGQLGDNSTTTRTSPVLVNTTSLLPGEKFAKAVSSSLADHTLALVAIPYIPRLVVEQPAGTGLASGTSSVDFPTSSPNSTTSKTFTIRNDGIVPLAIGSVTISGPQASEFVLTSPPATTLAPGASTTLTITFTSGAGFNRRAELHLASNDPYFSDFKIDLTAGGTGTLTANYTSASDVPLAVAGFTATGSTVNFSLAFPPATGTPLTVVRNTSNTFIEGTFDNLSQGQIIILVNGGKKYRYTANYFGGDGNDLVLQWADVRPLAWGRNLNGQLGNAGTTLSNTPVDITTTGVLAGKTIVSFAAGGSHSLALCSDGTLAAWGLGTSGQLGNGGATSSNVPVAVNQTGTLSGKKIAAIAAGLNHSMALCSDGTVRTWGANSSGQLGNASTSTSQNPVAVNIAGVLSGKKVVSIAAGQNHCLALCSDGTLVSWGANSSGQLGSGESTSFRNVPVAVNQTVALLNKTVVGIACGLDHSLALCSDGSLRAWGSDFFGQLGNSSYSFSGSNVPVTVNSSLALQGAIPTLIASGSSHNLVLCSNGSMFGWGYNSSGQLGIGATGGGGDGLVQVNSSGVLSGKNIISIASGASHCLALASDGTLASWGANSSGQLGDGTTTQRTLPVTVSQAVLLPGERFTSVFSGSQASHGFAIAAVPAPNLTQLDTWRMTHFQTYDNTGNAADLATPRNDGITNLMKFATGMDPSQPGRMPGELGISGANLVFTYSRSKAAVLDGITFIIEWSDSLSPGPWRQDGVSQTEEDQGETDLITAVLPAPSQQRGFVRLRVERP